MGLVGGATKSDVSNWLLGVATAEVSATPGSVDSAFGLETSRAPMGAESTLTPGVSVATPAVSTTSGLADAQAGSDASWDPTATGSTLRPEFWVSGWTDATALVVSASGLLGSTSALTTAATTASSPKLFVGVPSI